jgi:hypothetical protein
MTLSSKYRPINYIYNGDKYNGYFNITSVLKAPLFASKAYYSQCNDSISAQPIQINKAPVVHNDTHDKDDIDLYYDCWIDIEPHTGAVVGAKQFLLVSTLIEKDDLFEIDDKFVPVYLLFRSGNFTEPAVLHVFGDLLVAVMFKQIVQLIGACLIFFFISLLIFSFFKIFFSKQPSEDIVVPLNNDSERVIE